MRAKLLGAVMIGGVVGAVCGLVEAVVWLGQLQWWLAETHTIAIAMLIYGLLSAGLTGFWGCLALRMDPATFQVRAWCFSLVSMAYVFGGFYINLLWFPRLLSLPSLVFTGAWTVAWLAAVARLVKIRQPAAAGGPARTWTAAPRIVLAGLTVLAGVSFIPTLLEHRNGRVTATHATVASPQAPNILLIVMDTTRADRLSCYGYLRPTTPNLDRLARDGVLFEQTSSAAPWTLPSHASLFTGLYPSQHGAEWMHHRLDDQLTTLAELLRDHGYHTVGFSNNGWVSQAMNFDQGFESFTDFRGAWRIGWAVTRLAAIRITEKFRKALVRHADAGAARTNRAITRWLDGAYDPSRPFFLFINYIEPHFVYDPPEPYRSRFLRAENRAAAARLDLATVRFSAPPVHFDQSTEAVLNDLYDGEIAYLDAKVGELIEELRRRGLLDKTLVLITSDHGESIGDHAIFQHQFCVYETLLQVPLIVRYPAIFPAGTRVTEPVSLVDVMPTIITLLDLEAPSLVAAMPGHSWVGSSLAVPQGRSLLAEYQAPQDKLHLYRRENTKPVDTRYFTRNLKSLYSGTRKFIWASDGQHELYDLAQDPEEAHNIIQRFPEQAKAMEAQLSQLLQHLPRVGNPEEVKPMDEATRAELRALGYLQ